MCHKRIALLKNIKYYIVYYISDDADIDSEYIHNQTLSNNNSPKSEIKDRQSQENIFLKARPPPYSPHVAPTQGLPSVA